MNRPEIWEVDYAVHNDVQQLVFSETKYYENMTKDELSAEIKSYLQNLISTTPDGYVNFQASASEMAAGKLGIFYVEDGQWLSLVLKR